MTSGGSKLAVTAALILACFVAGAQAQGNIVASVGSDGIFLVDSMYAPMHQTIMNALARISN